MTELQRQLAESSAQWSAEREQLVQKVNSTETRLVEVQHKDNQEKSTLLKVSSSSSSFSIRIYC